MEAEAKPLGEQKLLFQAAGGVLRQKITKLLLEEPWWQEEDWVMERAAWEETLGQKLAQGQPLMLLLLDACGRSCQQTERQFPRVLQTLDQKVRSVLGADLAASGGRRRREAGEDELWYLLAGPVVKRSPWPSLARRLDKALNSPRQRAYFGLVALTRPQQPPLGVPLLLRAADLALLAAKKNWKEGQGPGWALARWQGADNWSLSFAAGATQPLTVDLPPPKRYPAGLVVTAALAKLRQELARGWQLGLVCSPLAMKEINRRWGMVGGDEFLLALAEGLDQLASRLAGRVYKIGPNFVLTLPPPADSTNLKAVLADWQQEWSRQAEGQWPPFGVQLDYFPSGD